MGVAKTGCPCSIIDERFRAHDWTLQAGRSKALLGPDVSARCCPSRWAQALEGGPTGARAARRCRHGKHARSRRRDRRPPLLTKRRATVSGTQNGDACQASCEHRAVP
jgi:hypothetical protein